MLERRGLGNEEPPDPRRVEDGAYGLRWLALAHGLALRLDRSLVPQQPAGCLRAARRSTKFPSRYLYEGGVLAFRRYCVPDATTSSRGAIGAMRQAAAD